MVFNYFNLFCPS